MKELPVELLQNILTRLSLNDILSLSASSKENYKEVITELFTQKKYQAIPLHYLLDWTVNGYCLKNSNEYYYNLLLAYIYSHPLDIQQKTCVYSLLKDLTRNHILLNPIYHNLLSTIKLIDEELIAWIKKIPDFQLEIKEKKFSRQLDETFKELLFSPIRSLKNKIILVNFFQHLDVSVTQAIATQTIDNALLEIQGKAKENHYIPLHTLTALVSFISKEKMQSLTHYFNDSVNYLFYSDNEVSKATFKLLAQLSLNNDKDTLSITFQSLLSGFESSKNSASNKYLIKFFRLPIWEAYYNRISKALIIKPHSDANSVKKAIFKTLIQFLPTLPDELFTQVIFYLLTKDFSSKKYFISYLNKSFTNLPLDILNKAITIIEYTIEKQSNQEEQDKLFHIALLELLSCFSTHLSNDRAINLMNSLFPYLFSNDKYIIYKTYQAIQTATAFMTGNAKLAIVEHLHRKMINSKRVNLHTSAIMTFGLLLPELPLKNSKPIVLTLLNYMEHPDVKLRAAFITTLSQLLRNVPEEYTDKIIDFLLDNTNNKNPDICESAIKGLNQVSNDINKKYYNRIINDLKIHAVSKSKNILAASLHGFSCFAPIFDKIYIKDVINLFQINVNHTSFEVAEAALIGLNRLIDFIEKDKLDSIIDSLFKALLTNEKTIFQATLDVFLKCLMRLSKEEIKQIKSDMGLKTNSFFSLPKWKKLLLCQFWENFYRWQLDKTNKDSLTNFFLSESKRNNTEKFQDNCMLMLPPLTNT